MTGRPRPFSHYDARKYPTLGVVEGYTTWAPSYGELDDRFDIELLEAAGIDRRVAGARVVDLACGSGRIGAWAKRHGAVWVAGVDATPAMLALAARRSGYDLLVRGDVTCVPLAAETCDVVLCSLALCHVADAGAFFREARRLLRAGGTVALADYHPVFMYRGIPTHFPHPVTGAQLAIENHVHSFADVFHAARDAGLRAVDLRERFIDEAWVAASPSYTRHAGLPVSYLWAFDA